MGSIDLKNLPALFAPVLRAVHRYLTLIFIIAFLVAYGFLVVRINSLASSEPSDDAIAEKLQTVRQPKIDQTVLDRIQQLEDQNIEVKTLFDQARQSPFTE